MLRRGLLLALLASLSLCAQETAVQTAFRVRYVGSDSVYVEGGRSAGLVEGMKLVIKASGKESGDEAGVVAYLKVVAIAETSAMCEVVSKQRPLAVGDVATLEGQDAEKLIARRTLSNTRQYPAVVSFTEGDRLYLIGRLRDRGGGSQALLHAREHEVRGAVQGAAEREDARAAEAPLGQVEDRRAVHHRALVEEEALLPPGQRVQGAERERHRALVRRDDVEPATESLAHVIDGWPTFPRVESRELDEHVGRRCHGARQWRERDRAVCARDDTEGFGSGVGDARAHDGAAYACANGARLKIGTNKAIEKTLDQLDNDDDHCRLAGRGRVIRNLTIGGGFESENAHDSV